MPSCSDELIIGNVEASSQICSAVPHATFTHHENHCTELFDTYSDACGTSENTGTGPTCNLQNNIATLSDSYCGTDSDLLSQSQGLQLTNTQKVKMFAMELEMMKAPASGHSSQDSLFDSLTDMSAVPIQ